jgi:hypothetical protein
VLLLKPQGSGAALAYAAEWSWDNADGPGGALGAHVRLAGYGAWLLVSDTDRHRVLWLDWQQRALLGQFGETDTPGDDPAHLDRPTFVALQGTRAVIADSGNQRLLKVELRP